MVNKQTSKQVKNAAKVDTGGKPDRNRQRAPRRGVTRARSGAAATHTSSAVMPAAAAPEGTSGSIELSQNAALPPEPRAPQTKPQSQGADLLTAKAPNAPRPRASTKRALLIGMLERPEGASVAEIGQRLGWLPHTVRAAITGLRHAAREVTRAKDDNGQSVYRLAPAETPADL
jgi:hypothetical protein